MSRCARGALVEPGIGRFDGNAAAVRHRVARVDAEIEKRILKLVRIAQRRPQTDGEHGLDVVAGPTVRRTISSMDADQLVGIDRFRIERLAARKGQQPVRERRGARCRALRARNVAFEIIEPPLRQPRLHQLKAAGDPRQHIVEIVRDAAGELSDGFHLLRLHQLFARLLQLQLRLAPFGKIAGYLGKTDEPAVVIANRIDHRIGPELRAVLAAAPSFQFVATLAGCALKRLRRHSRRAIFGRVEHREMPPDHLRFAVALDARRPPCSSS